MKLDAKKLFWVLIGVNVLLVAATLGVFARASSTAAKKSQKIAQLKADQQTNDQILGNFRVLQSTLNANKDLEDVVQKVLPADKDQSAAFADLDKFSKSTGVPIQQITFDSKSQGSTNNLVTPSTIKGVSVISVTLNCAGARYDSLLTFLQKIETTQRRMQVTSLNITPNTTNPNLLEHIALSIDIYLKAAK